MGYNNGTYTRNHNFSADGSAGVKILAARVDTEFDDLASALTGVVWTRDGNTVPSTDIPMGGRKFVNVAAATSVGNYMRVREFIENVPIFMQDQESSADRISVSAQYFTSVSANQAPGDGTRILVRAGSDKSSAVMYLNGHSANVEFQGGSRAVNALVSGGIYEMIFSSADIVWRVTNPSDGRTAAERAAGVTPTNYQYPEYDPRRYYSASWATAIQTALDLGDPRIIDLPEGDLSVGTTLSIRVGGGLRGRGVETTTILFTANTDAIEATDARWITLKDFTLKDGVAAASRTAGAGVHFTGFGGDCVVQNVNIGPDSSPTNVGFMNGYKETGGQLNRTLINVRSTFAKEDGFLLNGPTTSSAIIACYSNAAGRDGYRFTGNHTYSTMISPACDAPEEVGYHFLGAVGGAGNQLGITLIAPGCEFNSATATTTNALKIVQGKHFEVITPYFSGSSGLAGDCIALEGNASFTTTNIVIRGGFAKDSSGGYGINIGSNCDRIRSEGCDFSNNSSGRVNNADLLTEFLPPDGNDAYEFRRPVLLGTSVATNVPIGSLAVKNNNGLRGVNAAGNDTLALVDIDSSNRVQLAGEGGDIRWGTPLVALGGGSSATLGTIGGSGPATATQNTWMRVVDSSGAAFWVPVWK